MEEQFSPWGKKTCLQGNPGEFEENMHVILSYPIRKTTFYLVSRYEQWDGSPVQTRNRNPRPGQNSGSQQQFFKHSRKRRKKQKQTNKKKPGQGEMYQQKERKKLSIPPKKYWLGSISSASRRVPFSAVSCRVFLTAWIYKNWYLKLSVNWLTIQHQIVKLFALTLASFVTFRVSLFSCLHALFWNFSSKGGANLSPYDQKSI